MARSVVDGVIIVEDEHDAVRTAGEFVEQERQNRFVIDWVGRSECRQHPPDRAIVYRLPSCVQPCLQRREEIDQEAGEVVVALVQGEPRHL